MIENYIFAGQSNAKPAPNDTQVGMQGAFILRMNQLRPNSQAATVNTAVGGSKMRDWRKDWRSTTHYGKMITAARNAGNIKGLVWWQGESDCRCSDQPPYTAIPEFYTWTSDFSRLISDIRCDLNLPDLPVVICQLAVEPSGIWEYAAWGGMSLQQSQIKEPRILMVQTNDQAALAPNDPHITSDGYAVVGARVANSMATLVGET